MSRSTN